MKTDSGNISYDSSRRFRERARYYRDLIRVYRKRHDEFVEQSLWNQAGRMLRAQELVKDELAHLPHP